MKTVLHFLGKITAQFRWRYFSWIRMCLIGIALFIFLLGWEFVFYGNITIAIAYPAILSLIGKAFFLGFIFAFQQPHSKKREV